MTDFVISTNEKDFLLNALKTDLRLDGRTSQDVRHVKLTLGPQLGTAEVELGRTRAIASISSELMKPHPARPNEGSLNFYVDFSPMAGVEFDDDRTSDKSIALSRVIERGLKDSNAIDMEALCVLAGESCWALRCDVRILDHDGNLTDCANIAAMVALMHFRRPDITVVGKSITIHPVDDRQPVALALHHIPICVTFAFFEMTHEKKGKDDWIAFVVDPSIKEEMVATSLLTITINQYSEVCCMSKLGGTALSPKMLLLCQGIANTKAHAIFKLIQNQVSEFEEKLKARGQRKLTVRVGQEDAIAPIDVFGKNIVKEDDVFTDDLMQE